MVSAHTINLIIQKVGSSMLRRVLSFVVVSFFVSQPVLAESDDADLATYGVHLGGSPFGGSVGFSYNTSPFCCLHPNAFL